MGIHLTTGSMHSGHAHEQELLHIALLSLSISHYDKMNVIRNSQQLLPRENCEVNWADPKGELLTLLE